MSDADAARLITRFEADISKFEEGMAKAEKRARAAAENIHKEFEKKNEGHGLFGEPGKALEGTFDRSRLAVLEEGGAKIPLFGQALEELGPAGLTAAAGLAAVGVALEQAEKAADFAKDIDEAAKKVGVTTTALQQYRLMLEEVGGQQRDADQALLEFNQRLGEATAGLSARAMKPFAALGFTQAELKEVKNGSDLLPEIAERISKLGSAAEQAAVADKLGLTPMLPLLREGSDKIREMSGEFLRMGLIMDEGMVKRGDEAAKKFEQLSRAIDVQLKGAFVDLAPALVAITKQVAELARGLSDVVQAFQAIERRSDTALEDRLRELMNTKRVMLEADGGHKSPAKQAAMDRVDAEMRQIQTELGKRAQERGVELAGAPEGSAHLIDQTPPKIDETPMLDAKARETYETQLKKLADAQKALETNLQARAELEKQAVDADTNKTTAGIDAEIAKIKASRLDSHKRAQIAELSQARTAAQTAALAQKELIDRQTADATAKTQLQLEQLQADVQTAALDLARTTATSRQKRMEIELQLLDLSERQQKAELDAVLASKTATDAEKEIAKAKLEQLRQLDPIKRAGIAQSNLSPGQQYLRQLNESLDESGQKAMVSALGHFNDALVKGLENVHNLGQAFHEMAQQIVADLLRIGVERAITLPLANALFGAQGGGASGGSGGGGLIGAGIAALGHMLGFAGGGDPPVGRASIVGEKGPELFVPRSAGTIVPNNLLAAVAGASRAASGARAPARVEFRQTIDLTGANGEDTIARIAHQKAMEGAAMAVEAATQRFAANLVATQTYSL